jgi:hypothetical protein
MTEAAWAWWTGGVVIGILLGFLLGLVFGQHARPKRVRRCRRRADWQSETQRVDGWRIETQTTASPPKVPARNRAPVTVVVIGDGRTGTGRSLNPEDAFDRAMLRVRGAPVQGKRN